MGRSSVPASSTDDPPTLSPIVGGGANFSFSETPSWACIGAKFDTNVSSTASTMGLVSSLGSVEHACHHSNW